MSTRTALQSPYLCARFYPRINAEQGGKKVGEIWHFCFALLLFVDSGSTLSITVSLHKKLHHLKIKGLSSHFFFLFMNSIEFPQGHISPGSLVCFVLWSCSYLPLSHCRVWEEEISSTPGKKNGKPSDLLSAVGWTLLTHNGSFIIIIIIISSDTICL